MKSLVNSQIGINDEELRNPRGLNILKREFTERMRAIKTLKREQHLSEDRIISSLFSSGGQDLIDDGKLSVIIGNKLKH